MVVVRRGNLLDTKFSLVSPSPARSSVFVEKSATLIHWLQLCRNADFIIIGLIQYHHGCDFFWLLLWCCDFYSRRGRQNHHI